MEGNVILILFYELFYSTSSSTLVEFYFYEFITCQSVNITDPGPTIDDAY